MFSVNQFGYIDEFNKTSYFVKIKLTRIKIRVYVNAFQVKTKKVNALSLVICHHKLTKPKSLLKRKLYNYECISNSSRIWFIIQTCFKISCRSYLSFN